MEFKIPDGELSYIPDFMSIEDSSAWFDRLLAYLPLETRKIKLFGKESLTPRKEAFFSRSGETYGYSGTQLTAHPFDNNLKHLTSHVEKFTGQQFNSVLINLYRDGRDSNGWHSDNEKELGKNPFIASLSLGETRRIQFKHRNKNDKLSIDLESGSLLLMGGTLQHYWKHQIPKTRTSKNTRLNLTFRYIVSN